ncbi:MAG: hypothetical protein OXG62_11860 [Nitrospinae bacterium]|nr:hypothetical protein [Nitrospinota bacterium]
MRYEVSDIAYKVIKEHEDEGDWVDVAIKATVENNSDDEEVMVELQGVDREGFQVCSAHLFGRIPSRKSKVLTTKELIEKSIFQMIAHWQQR